MEKIEYRAVIKFLFLKGNTPSQIKDELDSVYGDSAPSFTTVKFWAAEFKRGRRSLEDDERPGRPKTVTTNDNIAKVHQLVLDDRRIKVREIAEIMKMSKERVCHILNQDLGMRKLSARWVPGLLTLDHKLARMNISSALFGRVAELGASLGEPPVKGTTHEHCTIVAAIAHATSDSNAFMGDCVAYFIAALTVAYT
ncbi:protein GVQW3-like [Bactrocera tryoni]|uniref:protein GVQW3-like n=1 Tax=Bactrocera tryoni TaxID=59916 RepID=UPI001A9861B6|nr:protein GVQW3-like [Bactrocera tryoni]